MKHTTNKRFQLFKTPTLLLWNEAIDFYILCTCVCVLLVFLFVYVAHHCCTLWNLKNINYITLSLTCKMFGALKSQESKMS